MARITCRTPSTGKPIRISYIDVPDTDTSIAEAPDFSVPDPSEKFAERDTTDPSRAIRPGEIFFLTPLAAKNKSSTTKWIEVKIATEDSESIVFGRVSVPGNDTALIPIQGRSLFKRLASGTIGDELIVRAETADVFDVWISGEERLSNEHTGVV
jgi:hypothetical protein